MPLSNLAMFSPLISFIAGLLFLVPGSTGTHSSDVSGMWKDHSVSGHEIEFFYSGDQLFASSSLFISTEAIVMQNGVSLWIEDGSILIEGRYESGSLFLHLEKSGNVEYFQFERAGSAPGFLAANTSETNELNTASLGMIKGFPVGKAKSTASIFRVFLFQGNQMINSQVLDTETGFVFSQLPNGTYTVFFEAQGPTAIQPMPAYKSITVENGDVIEANVVLE